MKQEYFFGEAKWVGAQDRAAESFCVLRGRFEIGKRQKVTLYVLGLGFFKCYINGVCINPDTFLPLSSDYEATGEPKNEVLSAHRIYVPSFDITPWVNVGKNVIAIHFGGGWYTHVRRVFGLPKAIYRIASEEEEGMRYHVSDERCRVGKSFVEQYDFTTCEHHNDQYANGCLGVDFDDSEWKYATAVESLDTEYCTTDCPIDTLIEELPVRAIGKGERGIVYDCGENTVGYPVLSLQAARGETVEVQFSEERLPNGELAPSHIHKQRFSVVSDGVLRLVQPEFTWFGFRYFEVVGKAEPTCVKVVHADIPICSSFDCDNETLNWIYQTFLHTMLCNMHTGHPSDCPHLERRGYTGDGQLTCHAALSTLDAKTFYQKWLQDIADTQDVLSGHIQNAAPYIRSGGGPGGWGCAIVEVPYQLYRHYGDPSVLSAYYPNMRRYIDYLEAHSEFGLVTSDKEGEWCLGDWCGPNILYADKDITLFNQQILLPVAYVNTYFMVKALQRMREIAALIGKDGDVAEYEEKIALRRKAIQAAYFNAFDHNFMMNAQGANAFAVDLGLGDEQTYANMVKYYQKLGYLDTGIFATDILIRVLFEHGDGELAVALLSNPGEQGFAHWRQNGATTFHEYWDSNRSRSHNHPMFGAPTGYLFEYLLGIRQRQGSVGYSDLTIEPQACSCFHRLGGSMKTPNGTVAVGYTREDDILRFDIEIPKGIRATFRCFGQECVLVAGKNEFSVEIP